MRIALLLLPVVLLGCPGESCYARADASFQDVVEDCKAGGFTYDECPWLEEAERIQDERYKRCRR